MQVPGAQDDRVDVLLGAVLEGAGLVLDLLQQRNLLPVFRPIERRGRRAVAERDRLGTVLVTLRADVLGRIAAPDDQDVLALEFEGVAEIVRVQHPAVEPFEPLKVRHVRGREMAGGDHHVVELFRGTGVRLQVLRGDREFPRILRIGHPAHRGAKADPVAHAGLLDPPLDVVPQHLARRIGGDRLAEVLLERVVGEFEALLRAVRPEVAVHAAMDRLAVFVETGAPGVVPQAAPVGLLFVTHDLGNLGALFRGLLKGAQLRQAARSGTDNRHTVCHLIPSADRKAGWTPRYAAITNTPPSTCLRPTGPLYGVAAGGGRLRAGSLQTAARRLSSACGKIRTIRDQCLPNCDQFLSFFDYPAHSAV